MIKNIRHSGIVVKNKNVALNFYQKLLGFKKVAEAKEVNSYAKQILGIFNIHYIKLAVGEDLLELYVMPKDETKSDWNHVSFTVDNLDELYKKLKKANVKFISKPVFDPSKTHIVCFCYDPNNNLIELVEEVKKKVKGKKK